MSLTEETKKEMGYIEISPKCGTCRFIEERPCAYVDRMWYDYCTYSSLCNFRVSKHGTCEKHEIDKE